MRLVVTFTNWLGLVLLVYGMRIFWTARILLWGTGCFLRRKIIYGLRLDIFIEDNIASVNGKKINLKFHLPFLYTVNRKFIFNSFM